jgi:hypothetical protein
MAKFTWPPNRFVIACAEPAKGNEVRSIFAARFDNSTSNVRLVPGDDVNDKPCFSG